MPLRTRPPNDRWTALRHIAPVASLVAGLAFVVVVGPKVASGVRDRLHHDEAATAPTVAVPPTTAATSTMTPDPVLKTTAPPRATVGLEVPALATMAASPAPTSSTAAGSAPTSPPSAPTPTPTPTTAAAPTTTAPAPTPATTAPAPTPATTTAATARAPLTEVTTIQIVPPVRDVLVAVDGTMLASNDLGVIQIPVAQRHGTATFVGVRATPALRRIDLLGWQDGSIVTTRSLDDVGGPVAQIGVTISDRVTVSTNDPLVTDGEVSFTCQAGPIQLALGKATWVVSEQAVAADGAFTARSLTYTAQSLTIAGVTTPLTMQTFIAIPEAKWLVTT